MAAFPSSLGVFTFEALNYDIKMTTLTLSFWEKLVPPGKALEDEIPCPCLPTCCNKDQKTTQSSPSQIPNITNFEQIKIVVLRHEMLGVVCYVATFNRIRFHL